jgi:hypothetical protein
MAATGAAGALQGGEDEPVGAERRAAGDDPREVELGPQRPHAPQARKRAGVGEGREQHGELEVGEGRGKPNALLVHERLGARESS